MDQVTGTPPYVKSSGRGTWIPLRVYLSRVLHPAALLTLPHDIITYMVEILKALFQLDAKILSRDDAQLMQPPTVTSGVPLLGHLYGIFTQGSDYVKTVDEKYRLPLFTMTVPGYRVYVATTPEAVRAIHKNPKTMEFTEIQRIAMRKLFAYPEVAIDTLGEHLNGDGTLKLINKPGPELDEVNEKGQTELARLMQKLPDAREPIPLIVTLRQTLTLAICAALWDQDYPMLTEKTLEADFWTWVEHFWGLLIKPMPSITAREGYDARERLWQSILKYTEAGGHRHASKVVSAEYHLYRSLGLDNDVVARAGTVSLFVILSNTVMAAMWQIMIIFSKPELLAQIREEVARCTTTCEADAKKHIINTTKLKTECPVLLATFRETLRHYMDFSLNRHVADTTTVRIPSTDETFTLKKGSIVQVASPMMQKQESIWGEDTNDFRPCRFMSQAEKSGCPIEVRMRTYGVDNKTSIPDPARPLHVTKDQKTAFAAFGGGAHVCPGRHFAFHITAAFVAVLVSGYDMVAADGGLIIPPETENSLGHGVKLPHEDVQARMAKRSGYEHVEWTFQT